MRKAKSSWIFIIISLFALSSISNSARAALPEFQITLSEVVATGFDRPVQVTHAGDGSGRLFVVEQPGRIRILSNGAILPAPFLDIRSLVSYGGERGLLGLAFHPDYEANGFFYLNYTNLAGNTVVARYQVSSADPNQANPASALILFTITQPYSNHNGGQIAFGPDGYLYIGMGDGGSGGDPQNYAQNFSSPLGKMLRINVDTGSPYAIPADNPYPATPGYDPRIWAAGLRNPWRFSFDRATGDIYIGDVGQGLWEEISFQLAGTPGGINYGWRCYEGTHLYTSLPPCNSSAYLSTLTPPIAEYSHAEGFSVTGGFVYRGALYPNLVGHYFFGDYVTGKVYSLKLINRNPLTFTPWKYELTAGFNISCFGEGEDGELYVCDHTGGGIRHLADVAGPVANLSGSSISTSTPYANPAEVVTFTILLVNTGGATNGSAHLENPLPTGLISPANLTFSSGTAAFTGSTLIWDGIIGASQTVTITYQATVANGMDQVLVIPATLSGSGITPRTLKTQLAVPRPALNTTAEDFHLPGTQPNGLSKSLTNAIDCDTCHNAPIYDAWRGSTMSQAGRDPIFWAALTAANARVPNAGEYCLRCHAPSGWFDGRSAQPDGSSLLAGDIINGVTCTLCHRMVDSVPASDQTASIDAAIRAALAWLPPQTHPASAMIILDPEDRRRGPFELPLSFNYHSAYQSRFLGQNADAITEARLCGNCHNLDNPAHSLSGADYLPNDPNQAPPSVMKGDLFPIERTYDEWLNSTYATTGVFAPQFAGQKPDGIVRTCQDCHMPRQTGSAADAAFNPIPRDCQTTGCLPAHDLLGPNTWLPSLLLSPAWRLNATGESAYLNQAILRNRQFLQKAATLDLEILTDPISGQKTARVTVTNQTGHKLPTGYPEGRRMWLNVLAYAPGNPTPVFASGVYDPVSGQLLTDAHLKVYEVKQGISASLSPVVGLPAAPSFHFALNNATYQDNRIPPRGYTQAAFDQPGLRPVPNDLYADGQFWDVTDYPIPAEATIVVVRLFYQVASAEYIAFLQQYGGADGQTLGALWENSKSPPELMAVNFTPKLFLFFPSVSR